MVQSGGPGARAHTHAPRALRPPQAEEEEETDDDESDSEGADDKVRIFVEDERTGHACERKVRLSWKASRLARELAADYEDENDPYYGEDDCDVPKFVALLRLQPPVDEDEDDVSGIDGAEEGEASAGEASAGEADAPPKLLLPQVTLRESGVREDATLAVTYRRNPACDRAQVLRLRLQDKRRAGPLTAGSGASRLALFVPGDVTVFELKLRLWELKGLTARGMRPSDYAVSTRYADIGDGWITRCLLKDQRSLSGVAVLWEDDGEYDDGNGAAGDDDTSNYPALLTLVSRSQLRNARRLTRSDTMKQLFSAFVDRTLAYDLPNHLGLVTFGSEVTQRVELTPLLEDFRDELRGATPGGETRLFDALAECGDKLTAFAASQSRSTPRLRVLVISDGEDTKSTAEPWRVARQLQRGGIVVDAICIGDCDRHEFTALRSICKAGGVLCTSRLGPFISCGLWLLPATVVCCVCMLRPGTHPSSCPGTHPSSCPGPHPSSCAGTHPSSWRLALCSVRCDPSQLTGTTDPTGHGRLRVRAADPEGRSEAQRARAAPLLSRPPLPPTRAAAGRAIGCRSAGIRQRGPVSARCLQR